MSDTDTTVPCPSESAVRGRATRLGYSLVEFREGSLWSNEFGPFSISDMNNRIVAYGMTVEEVAAWINDCRAAESQ